MKGYNQSESLAVDRGIHRGIMLEMGLYNIHKEKTYKDKSRYSRKQKHKGKGYDE